MQKRGMAVAALLLVASTVMTGCSGSGGRQAHAIRIGVSFYTKTVPLYSLMEDGMRQEAKALGVDIEFAYANNSAETQSNQINTFVTKGVDIILASPVDVDALVPAYQQARSAGTPVISVANKLADADEDAFVGPDLTMLAKQTMEATLKNVPKSGSVLLLTGPPQIAFVQMQKEGWGEALAERPDVKVADTLVVSDLSTATAADVATSGLASHPGVNAVVSSLDDVSLGAIQAAKTAKLDLRKIFFAGWDGSPAALTAIRAGDYDLTLSMRATTWGKLAVKTAVDYVKGHKPAGHNVRTPYVLIDQKNIATLGKDAMS